MGVIGTRGLGGACARGLTGACGLDGERRLSGGRSPVVTILIPTLPADSSDDGFTSSMVDLGTVCIERERVRSERLWSPDDAVDNPSPPRTTEGDLDVAGRDREDRRVYRLVPLPSSSIVMKSEGVLYPGIRERRKSTLTVWVGGFGAGGLSGGTSSGAGVYFWRMQQAIHTWRQS